jgi:hypothetical protein
MAMIDPAQERRRLAEFYADQMDGELEKIAGQAYELTDLAREVLQAELRRRGLTTELAEAPSTLREEPQMIHDTPPPPPAELSAPERDRELRRMVTIRQIRDLPEALLAKSTLESAGVEAVLTDDNVIRLDWFWSNLLGGVKLSVGQGDVEDADEILEQPIPEGFEAAGVGEYQQPYCPRCQSLDVTFKELNRPLSYLTLWIQLPIPIYRRAWLCHSCGIEWEDDRETEAGPTELPS